MGTHLAGGVNLWRVPLRLVGEVDLVSRKFRADLCQGNFGLEWIVGAGEDIGRGRSYSMGIGALLGRWVSI